MTDIAEETSVAASRTLVERSCGAEDGTRASQLPAVLRSGHGRFAAPKLAVPRTDSVELYHELQQSSTHPAMKVSLKLTIWVKRQITHDFHFHSSNHHSTTSGTPGPAEHCCPNFRKPLLWKSYVNPKCIFLEIIHKRQKYEIHSVNLNVSEIHLLAGPKIEAAENERKRREREKRRNWSLQLSGCGCTCVESTPVYMPLLQETHNAA